MALKSIVIVLALMLSGCVVIKDEHIRKPHIDISEDTKYCDSLYIRTASKNRIMLYCNKRLDFNYW